MSSPARRMAWVLALGLGLGAHAAGAVEFFSPTPIAVPAVGTVGAADPYPSDILVSGVAETVEELTVTLFDFSHQWPADVDILLVGPQGQNLVLMSDAGGSSAVVGLTLVFDDAAVAAIPQAGPLVSGTYRPANYSGTNDAFPEPAPARTGASALSTFAGTNPNGLWSLYVVDDDLAMSGSIDGWSLSFVPEPEQAAAEIAAALALLACTRRRGGCADR